MKILFKSTGASSVPATKPAETPPASPAQKPAETPTKRAVITIDPDAPDEAAVRQVLKISGRLFGRTGGRGKTKPSVSPA